MNERYPFSAIVGQDEMKLALILNAIDPRLSGVLIRGQRGTAKSTAVRALAALLPGQKIVELPVSATEDRVVGTLDLKAALDAGETRVNPGLLPEADGNLLYVDEVNLLEDHLVDAILDAAASGTCTVERDGVRATLPARICLIGSMNPEEGELRPQLLDRFGLCVTVSGETDPARRAEVVRRRMAYEADPEGFCRQWNEQDHALTKQILAARERLDTVTLSDDAVAAAVTLCLDHQVEGHRADITLCKTAVALAAWENTTAVTREQLKRAAALVLPHRSRPFDSPAPSRQPVQEDDPADPGSGKDAPPSGPEAEDTEATKAPSDDAYRATNTASPATQDPVQCGEETRLAVSLDQSSHPQKKRTIRGRGRAVRTEPYSDTTPGSLSPDATLRAAALRTTGPEQKKSREPGAPISLTPEDLRQTVREAPRRRCILFCVDASRSLRVRHQMAAVKTLILSLLNKAYQNRDEVALVTFHGEGAEFLLPFTRSSETAKEKLQSIPTGGKTPLAEGLALSREELLRHTRRHPEREPVLVVLTDGRANHGNDALERAIAEAEKIRATGIRTFVFDTETGPVRLGLARELSEALGADYFPYDPKTDHKGVF
ncbi:MAG: VWA domain-containing protein [Clostridia bacterium]|nr:VWA domain-containing protein [Clostridia bacterium]